MGDGGHNAHLQHWHGCRLLCAEEHGSPPYTNLLEEWNQFLNEEIDKWLADESANFDEYDNENLRMAGQYLQNAVKPELWCVLESTVKG